MVWPPYWVCQRLIAIAIEYWPRIHGEALWQGVDLLRMPLDAFCDAVYAWAVRDATAEQRQRFDAALAQPPAEDGPDPVTGWDDPAEAAAFLAAMHAHHIGADVK